MSPVDMGEKGVFGPAPQQRPWRIEAHLGGVEQGGQWAGPASSEGRGWRTGVGLCRLARFSLNPQGDVAPLERGEQQSAVWFRPESITLVASRVVLE